MSNKIEFSFFKQQGDALRYLADNNTSEVLYGGGAGGGKSFLGCYWIIKNCIQYPESVWLMGRAVLKVLKETTLKTFNSVLKMFRMKHGVDYRYIQDVGYKFFNGSEVIIKDLAHKPSDPDYDNLGSLEITGAFIDECGQITEKCWETVCSRIRLKLDQFGITPKIFGSCNPSKNWVYRRFYKPTKDGTIEQDKVFIQSLVTQNIFIDSTYKRNLDKLTDPQQRARLRDGDWEYDHNPNRLISSENLDLIFGTNSVKFTNDYFISADIARLGSDKTIIAVWQGWNLIELHEYDKNLITDASRLIKDLMVRFNIGPESVVIDEDGVGGGVVDLIGGVGFVNNSRPIVNENTNEQIQENFQNLKSQCGYKLADIINSRNLLITATLTKDQEEKIVQHIEQLQSFSIDDDGKLKIKPKQLIKQEIGESPDYLDVMIMRCIFEFKITNRISYKNIFF